MAKNECEKDERVVSVEKASQSAGYLVLLFAILLDIAYRSFFRGEAPWDLFAIIFMGSAAAIVYQARKQIWTPGRFLKKMRLSFLVGLVVAAVVVLLIRLLR